VQPALGEQLLAAGAQASPRRGARPLGRAAAACLSDRISRRISRTARCAFSTDGHVSR
jgi:hypothetical protein